MFDMAKQAMHVSKMVNLICGGLYPTMLSIWGATQPTFLAISLFKAINFISQSLVSNRLILIVGISGSGKSTYIENYYKTAPSTIVLSSDRLRGVLGKDDSDQSVSGQVFRMMEALTKYFLKYYDGKDIIIDATNTTIARRKDFFKIAHEVGNCQTVCWCIPCKREFAKERNRKRDRVVPDFVIDRQFDQMQWPNEEEADQIIWVTGKENHA